MLALLVTVPADTWISSKKLSLSEANFLSACSKSSSLRAGRSACGTLMVATLLRLEVGEEMSKGAIMLPMLFLASKLYREDLLIASGLGELGEFGRGVEGDCVSRAASSCMVACTGAGLAGCAERSSNIWAESTPATKK